MGIVEKRLEELGLALPGPKPPVGNYLGSKKIGELLFASARVSDCIGEVGTEITLEKAKDGTCRAVKYCLQQEFAGNGYQKNLKFVNGRIETWPLDCE